MKMFLKDNLMYICVYFASVLLTVAYASMAGALSGTNAFYIIFFNLVMLAAYLTYRYITNKKLYDYLAREEDNLDESGAEFGGTIFGQALTQVLNDQYRNYEKNIQEYNNSQKEHLTFMNHWVHQMKTPVSVIQLYLQESNEEEIAENIKEEVEKLNKGLNMAMYFARLDNFQKDFLVENVNINSLLKEVINEEKRLFIKNRVFPELQIDESLTVYTDKKWMFFVLEQLIINGVKYSKGEGKKLTISASSDKYQTVLTIEDRGVGIPQKDIRRVFDAFYTGENGRRFGESTGMGLYIVKKVCDHLGHKVEIQSEVNVGTKISIIFLK